MSTLTLTGLSGESRLVPAAAVDALAANLSGPLLRPGMDGYEEARQIWNGIFDRHPGLIARCTTTEDVIHGVNFAREHGVLLAVKGGGHNSAGNGSCDGGLMIDLSPMNRVQVDPQARTAQVEGGALLAHMDQETQRHGLAVSGGGIISHTGVGGLALGGGFGWISRKHGLAVDNLLAAQVVTADGQVRHASPDEHPDLFWALRGGGGNFGVVTRFTFRCVPLGPEVYSGLMVKRFGDAGDYMRFHRDYVRTLPDEMTAWMVIRHAPPLPFLPPEVHGQRVLVVPFVWLGAEAEGARLIEPMRQATPSLGEAVGMNRWVDWQSGFDGLVGHGARNYWKSHHLAELSDPCIREILRYGAQLPSDECEIFIPHMEGAPARVPEEATAYAHRHTPFVLNIHTRWQRPEDDERCLAWVQAFHGATRPFARGVYVNFLSDEGANRVRDAYTPSVWERLVQVKRRYDPQNLFRLNQNIAP